MLDKIEKIGCIKFLLIFFNSVFWASGIALIVMGAVSRSSYAQFESFTGGGLSQCAVVIIVVGVVITAISFLGCFGAWTDNRYLLGLFTAVLIIILIIEMAAGIVLYVFRSKVEGKIKNQAKKVIIEYNPNLVAIIDDIQDKFHCCGAENYTDWLESSGWKRNNSVPDSCCRVEREDCGNNITAGNIYYKGCVGSIKTFLQKKLKWIAAVCIGLGLVEITGAVLGCLVLREAVIKNGYEQK
ncbi:CD63 antigen-like [Acipenser ruthenus]|uniref:CD63 antigen-like n=1 Tax=Acipenser ruthenus TaxID=7906 RepID=UPI00145BAE33|nr:CD63 antigen-like [Acipenser ruthenus]